MEDIQIEIESLVRNYNNKIADLTGRIVILEAQNEALYKALSDKESSEDTDKQVKEAMGL